MTIMLTIYLEVICLSLERHKDEFTGTPEEVLQALIPPVSVFEDQTLCTFAGIFCRQFMSFHVSDNCKFVASLEIRLGKVTP